jgi:hypothetical protein
VVRIKHIIIAVLVVAIGAVGFVFFFQSEESKVKRQFKSLSEKVSKEPDESKLAMALKAQQLQTLFAENCGLGVPSYAISGNYTPQDISSLALTAFSHYSKISLKFYDMTIDVTENGIARVLLTANLTGKLATGEYIDETHELSCILKKVESSWLFSDFEVVEVLEK